MREIMISIQPQWVEKILDGEKTIEIRKTMPKCELPCKVYIYCTKNEKQYFRNVKCCESLLMDSNSLGKVVAEFTLNKIDRCGEAVYDANRDLWEDWNTLGLNNSCVHPYDLEEYSNGYEIYAWHIDNLKIYDKPKELSEFYKNNYKKIIDELEFNGCDEKHCKYAVGNSFIGDDGYCDYSGCPKLKLQKPPQSWCYVEENL